MIWARIFGAVPGWAKAALAGVLGAVMLFGAGYVVGSREATQRAREQALIDYADTMERIHANPDVDLSDDAAVRRELCALANLRDCPLSGD